MEEIEKLYNLVPAQNKSLQQWKAQGKNVFGYMCSATPEEIIYAAGILPVRLLGNPMNLEKVQGYYPAFTCYVCRSALELGLAGEYKELDGIVVPHMCDGTYGLAGVVEHYIKPPYFYWLPHPHSAKAIGAHDFWLKELTLFKGTLEEFSSTEITDQALSKAIEVYNENRALLREVYDLRGRTQPVISGFEAARLVLLSLLAPKEESNKLISQFLEEAKKRDAPLQLDGPRLHISGSVFFDLELFKLIESLGGIVVSDDLCTGTRYFWEPVDTALPPLEAIVRRYLEKVPCPCMAAEGALEERLEYILEMVKRYKADGVIFSLQKYCDTHQFDHPFLVEELQKAGLPVLTVEVEQSLEADSRGKLEEIFEIIRGKHGE